MVELSTSTAQDASTSRPVVYKWAPVGTLCPMGTPYQRPYLEHPDKNSWLSWFTLTSQRRLVVALVALVLFGSLLRLVNLGSWSLWFDESLTLADSYHEQDLQNPLGYALMSWVYHLGAERPSEFMLRLPSAILGILSIALTAWCFRPVAGRYASLGAAALMAASAWHLYWSQSARFYTLAQVVTLLGTGLVLRSILQGGTKRLWIGLLLFGLAPLIHPSAAIVLGAFIVALWLARFTGAYQHFPKAREAWPVLQIAILAGVFIGTGWCVQVLLGWEERQGEGTPLHMVLSMGYLVTPTVGLGLLVGAWAAFSHLKGPTTIPVLVVLLGGCGALVLSFFVRVSAQYLFQLLPWICLVAAMPLALLQLAEQEADGVPVPARKTILCAVYSGVLLLPSMIETGLYFTVRNGDRPHWREAYRYVFDHQRGGDLILGMAAPVGEYYLDPRRTDLRSWRRVGWLDEHRARLPENWSRYPRRTWFVIDPELFKDWPERDRNSFRELLREECQLVASYPIPLTPRSLGLEVWLRE